MTKIYSKKENIVPYYFLIGLGIAVIIFGLVLANYFAWQAFPILGIALFKINTISNSPELPTIKLNDEGLQVLAMFGKPLIDQQFYPFSSISSINIMGISHFGNIRLKANNKQVLLDSSGIPKAKFGFIKFSESKNFSFLLLRV